MSSTASPGPFDISGKVALVTGSSRGIGSALATGLAEAGAVVVLNSRNSDVLEAERRRIADATGATVHAYAFDVTDSAAVRDAATRIERRSARSRSLSTTPACSTAPRFSSSATTTSGVSWTPT